MKHIIHEAQSIPEVAEWTDDFDGSKFDSFGPSATITIRCGYGSKRDLHIYEFHLGDESLDKLMVFIKKNLTLGDKVVKHCVPNEEFDVDTYHEYEEDLTRPQL